MLQIIPILLLVGLKLSEADRIIKPGSSAELQSALDNASQGDTIQMLPMVYKGDFTITKDGGVLTGDYNSTIESDGVGLTIRGSGWKIKSFWIKGPAKGILVEGRENSLEGLVLQRTGRAVVVRGEENTVKSCVISEADLGIIIEGSRNKLYYNSVNIQTPAIIIPKDSCCNTLDGNVANGEMNIDGPGNKLNGNVANHGLYVKGCDNEFSNNVANGASFPENCKAIDKGGNVYRGLGPGDTDLPNPNQPMNQGFNTQQTQYNNGYNTQGTQNNNGFNSQPSNQQNVPVQVFGNSGSGSMPKCSCTCGY